MVSALQPEVIAVYRKGRKVGELVASPNGSSAWSILWQSDNPKDREEVAKRLELKSGRSDTDVMF